MRATSIKAYINRFQAFADSIVTHDSNHMTRNEFKSIYEAKIVNCARYARASKRKRIAEFTVTAGYARYHGNARSLDDDTPLRCFAATRPNVNGRLYNFFARYVTPGSCHDAESSGRV